MSAMRSLEYDESGREKVKHKVEEELREDLAALRPEEAAVLTLLRNRLNLTLKDKLQASFKAD